MKYFLLSICALLIGSATFGIAGKAGPGCCLSKCLSDCESNSSVTSSEKSKCDKNCNDYFEKLASQEPTVIPIVIAPTPKKGKEAPKAPPAPATVKKTAAKTTAPIKTQDTTPKA